VDPVAFHIGQVSIRYAGLLYLVAIASAWVYARRVAVRRHWDVDLVLPGVAVVVVAAYLGARVHGAINDPFADVSLRGLVRAGDLSFFGGLAAGSVALLAFLRWTRLPLGAVADELALIAPAVYALFRLGCFLNGDDYGRPTSLPWGMSFPNGAPPTADRVHPVQLYEIALMIPVWFALKRPRYMNMSPGTRSFDLCVLLGLERFLVEFLRDGMFSAPQMLALALLLVGGTGRILLRRRTS
jgi:phosphatidylglycerol:prolipoprotein diacylglycerol transferase